MIFSKNSAYQPWILYGWKIIFLFNFFFSNSSQFSRQQSDSEDGSKNSEVTFVGEKRISNPPPPSAHRSPSVASMLKSPMSTPTSVATGLPTSAGKHKGPSGVSFIQKELSSKFYPQISHTKVQPWWLISLRRPFFIQ